MFGLLLSALIALPHAAAGQFEISVTRSLQSVRDPRWRKLSSSTIHSATGVSVGMGMTNSLSVLLGFNTGKAGSIILVPDVASGSVNAPPSELGFNLATTLTQYQLGARYRWKWRKRLVPTTTIQALFGHASLRMDEDVENDGDEVSSHHTAMAAGFEFAGGLEYTLAFLSDEKVRINLGAELGYTNLFKLHFNDDESSNSPNSLGELNLGGASLTMYLGSRF
jgi:hypothetical protein